MKITCRGIVCLLLAIMVAAVSPVMAEGVNDELLRASKPAKTLSEYRLFTNAPLQEPNRRVVPYDLNNPLFTDYSLKYRFVYVPEGASPAPYEEREALRFPVGSVLVKTFAYPRDFREPDRHIRLIETRLLIHKKGGWKAYPYVWDAEGREAVLKVAGKRVDVDVVWQDGKADRISYAVPNMNQCKGCHVGADKAIRPIGPKVRNLNRPSPARDGPPVNQLRYLRQIGYLGGGPQKPEDSPRVPEPFNSADGTLFERARSYLDGNCAHCHAPGKPADTSGLYLDYLEERAVHWGVNKTPVAAGRGSGGLAVNIRPGQPEKSILLYRMNSEDPGVMMPELGRSLIHREGVDLIRAFIKSLEE
ncbi:SO2930 family diheme c-type cytochrome [Sneathiella chinensis]|uniref:Cytochrome c domain-containing protein n=1 Tax=Sneathiella chinensis TaxID=349750 RepID=A0ABQ5TZW7_9PROT|nr:SO2930 family diheme c-type cytochrome [Sneathiella chinensis]GLQ05537.1 hypothetical protein GCM10007924_07580 [Sneathiella chinensis]